MATSVEVYEALKDSLGEDAARMIAESPAMTDQVATRVDLAMLQSELGSRMDRLEFRMDRLEARVDARFGTFEARIFRWMLGFFATLFVAQAAMILAILTKL